MKLSFVLFFSLVFFSLIGFSIADVCDQNYSCPGMMRYIGDWQASPWGLFMWIFMILLLIALVLLIIWLMQQIQYSRRRR